MVQVSLHETYYFSVIKKKIDNIHFQNLLCFVFFITYAAPIRLNILYGIFDDGREKWDILIAYREKVYDNFNLLQVIHDNSTKNGRSIEQQLFFLLHSKESIGTNHMCYKKAAKLTI